MAKRNLVLIAACLAVAVTVLPAPAAAGQKKEIAFAVSLAQKGLWKEAAFRFREILEKNPHNPRVWNNLAVAYEASGEFDKAHEAYMRAADLPGQFDELEMNRSSFEAFYKIWSAHHGSGGDPSSGTGGIAPDAVNTDTDHAEGKDGTDADGEDKPHSDPSDDHETGR